MKKSQFSEEQIVRILQEAARGEKSQSQLCREHGVSENTFYTWKRKYGGLQSQDVRLLKELEQENSQLKRLLAERDLEVARPGIGYRMARALVLTEWESEFGALNPKRVYRLWKEERLTRKKTRKKRRTGATVPLAATRANQVWCLDCCYDACLNGSKLKVLAVKDEYTRECLTLEVATRLNSHSVRRILQRLQEERGVPEYLRSDNGPEFIARHLSLWLLSQGSSSQFIKPGSPWQNGHAESFMARLRAECLDAEVFHNLADARLKLNLFRRYYNQRRPHSALGYIPPAQFAEKLQNKSG